jgi:hypothetical protein
MKPILSGKRALDAKKDLQGFENLKVWMIKT